MLYTIHINMVPIRKFSPPCFRRRNRTDKPTESRFVHQRRGPANSTIMPKVRVATARTGPEGGRKTGGGRGRGCDVNTVSHRSGSGNSYFFFYFSTLISNVNILIVHRDAHILCYGRKKN